LVCLGKANLDAGKWKAAAGKHRVPLQFYFTPPFSEHGSATAAEKPLVMNVEVVGF
jgi:hypothetical protein